MSKSILLALSLVLILFVVDSQAARRDNRQVRQRARIHEGVQSGELTKGEAHRARRKQRQINRVEVRAEKDGVVTAGEKMRIENAQDKASAQIYNMKHNDNQAADPRAPAVDVPAADAPAAQ